MVACARAERPRPLQRAIDGITTEVAVAYVRALALVTRPTPHSEEKCLLAVCSAARTWSQTKRLKVCAGMARRADVVAETARCRDAAFVGQLLGRHERRAILAVVARTPVDPASVAPRDVIAASRLDGELAGDLVRGGGAQVQVNTGPRVDLSLFMLPTEPTEPTEPRAVSLECQQSQSALDV